MKNSGLLELLIKQKTNEAYISSNDLNDYKEILVATNAHRKDYSSSEPIREDKSFKYMNFIAKLFPHKE